MSILKQNELKEYIEQSEKIEIEPNFCIRLSKELMKKYVLGLYTKQINTMKGHMKAINDLGLPYPANAKPIFYLYIVPDNNFKELLSYPIPNKDHGGKPVICYDLDGFSWAYGISSNMIENENDLNVSQIVNEIHELAHLVYCQFFERYFCRMLGEGFAECLPLYLLNMENNFTLHQETLSKLKKEHILTANQLITLEPDEWNDNSLYPDRSCSFRIAYLSSYLFVRSCLENIELRFQLNKVAATQKFFEILRTTTYTKQLFLVEIAQAIGVEEHYFLNENQMQYNLARKLVESKN